MKSIKKHTCPNPKCPVKDKNSINLREQHAIKRHGYGMYNLATICPDYDNFYCFICGSHLAGYNGELKFYTKEEWEDCVNTIDGIDWRTLCLS